MNHQIILADSFLTSAIGVAASAGVLVLIGFLFLIVRCYRKVQQGQALVRNGLGGTKVYFSAGLVIPILHRAEYMDISVKRIEIDRSGNNGLICKDNIRADIKVAFFVRINHDDKEVARVAQSIGCERASNHSTLETLFDAKFSEGLKTVGKRFDFVELYENRDTFKEEILKVIGTDLNGYVLDDAAIDYLEQTSLSSMDPNNILDAEGIKKITELTAAQAKLSNNIQRDKERVIKQQDVEAREAILELERQLAETEAQQARKVTEVQAREQAEAKKVQEEQRLKSEQARIATEEELCIAEENKNRQIIVAQKNKERTEAVENERVTRDRDLEIIERDRLTALKGIERDKSVEIEKKNIQEVIKDRVALEKTVVVEEQKIKDTEAFATADREKQVAITRAEKEGQEALLKRIKAAEADKEAAILKADQEAYEQIKHAEAAKTSAERHAEEIVIEAEARQAAAEKDSSSKRLLAEALTAETAAPGLGEAQVRVAMAGATEKQGTAEAKVSELKFAAEAKGITEKAGAMKLFEEAGQSHEEFKLNLEKAKAVELAGIDAQRQIAAEQSHVVAEALKSAKIDIVGGETQFFDRITQAITAGKAVDRAVDNSRTLSDVRDTFFNGDPDYFKAQLRKWLTDFGIASEDIRNLTVSAMLGKMLTLGPDEKTSAGITDMLHAATRFGLAHEKAEKVLGKVKG